MSAAAVSIPDHLPTPDEVELKQSGIDAQKIGIWAKTMITQDSKFGPFEGNRVQVASENMDSAFVWEIVEPETNRFLCYVDATDARVGNWMKYIGCARFYEEQNIVSQQEGTDIFYKAIKDIQPGEELLTWYEKIRMRKKRGRKKKVTASVETASRSSTPTTDIYSKQYKSNPKRKAPSPELGKSVDQEPAKRLKRIPNKFREFTDTTRISEQDSDSSDEAPSHKSEPPAQAKKKSSKAVKESATKTSTTKDDSAAAVEDGEKLEEGEDDVFECEDDADAESVSTCSTSLRLEQDASVGSASRTSSTTEPDKFQFDLKPHHIVKSRLGRKVFKCDICVQVYRHAFSLKRHYIRNHINYNYVTKADVQNCQITTEAMETLAMALALQKKQQEQAQLLKTTTKSESNSRCETTKAETDNVPEPDREVMLENPEVILSPGKDENRNKIANDEAKDNDTAATESKCSDSTQHTNSCAAEVDTTPPAPLASGEKQQEVEDSLSTHVAPEMCEADSGDTGNSAEGGTAPPDPADPARAEQKSQPRDDDIQQSSPAENTPASPKSAREANDAPVLSESTARGDLPALYRCHVCNFCFDTIEKLKTHVEDHPDLPNMKTFGCDKCDMRFSHKQNLVRHNAVHTGAKPFTCRYCGKNFPTVTNQKRHERIHQGRRVQCDYCASSFTQSGDLKKHVRKLHPEHYHECAFCAKYYSCEADLVAHLDTHNESFASNRDEETRRRQEFRVDLEKDREESMRLAECKPGYKFACTVCRKRFHDYPNMCRHRRLAHQRHLITSKKLRMCDAMKQPDGDKSISDMVLLDLEPNSYFYSNVARNISENLKYFVEGGRDDMQNNAAYIRWKSEEQPESGSTDHVPIKDELRGFPRRSTADSAAKDDVFSRYNFPVGFKFRENYTEEVVGNKEIAEAGPAGGDTDTCDKVQPPEIFEPFKANLPPSPEPELRPRPPLVLPPAPIPREFTPNGIFRPFADVLELGVPSDSSKRTFDTFQINSGNVLQVPGLPEPQDAAYDFSTRPMDAHAPHKHPSPPPTLIKTPSVKICAVCRSIFSNPEMYSRHMIDKHKIAVEASPTSAKENLPILAAKHVPHALTEVTISSTSVTSPKAGTPSISNSPRACLIVPQVPKPTTKAADSCSGTAAPLGNAVPSPLDLSPTTAVDLSKSSEIRIPQCKKAVDLTCRETMDSLFTAKDKSNKAAAVKNKSNGIILQTPKIVPRFDNPLGRKTPPQRLHKNFAHSNGLTIPYFPMPVLNLTKDAKSSGLGSFLDVDPCLQTGATGFSQERVESSETPLPPDEPGLKAENPDQSAPSAPTRPAKSWPSCNPNPVGLLNICTSQVPSQTDKVKYSCTKCSKKFSASAKLHAHILDCASASRKMADSAERAQTKYVFKKGLGRIGIQAKKMPSASRMKLKAAIGYQNKMHLGKMKSSAFFTGKDDEYYNSGDPSVATRRRPRNPELTYNPQNHLRRRELTELLDMHRCHGCGLRFGTISLLERHIRVCKHKEKIKEMHSSKTTVTSRRIHKPPKESFKQDAHKQKCRYCDKLFTYIGMLKKHILDICPVRREYFEHGNEDHIDKEWEDTIMCIGGPPPLSSLNREANSPTLKEPPTPNESAPEDVKPRKPRKGRGRRKNRKWGNTTRRKSPDTDKDVKKLGEKPVENGVNAEAESDDAVHESDDADTISLKDENTEDATNELIQDTEQDNASTGSLHVAQIPLESAQQDVENKEEEDTEMSDHEVKSEHDASGQKNDNDASGQESTSSSQDLPLTSRDADSTREAHGDPEAERQHKPEESAAGRSEKDVDNEPEERVDEHKSGEMTTTQATTASPPEKKTLTKRGPKPKLLRPLRNDVQPKGNKVSARIGKFPTEGQCLSENKTKYNAKTPTKKSRKPNTREWLQIGVHSLTANPGSEDKSANCDAPTEESVQCQKPQRRCERKKKSANKDSETNGVTENGLTNEKTVNKKGSATPAPEALLRRGGRKAHRLEDAPPAAKPKPEPLKRGAPVTRSTSSSASRSRSRSTSRQRDLPRAPPPRKRAKTAKAAPKRPAIEENGETAAPTKRGKFSGNVSTRLASTRVKGRWTK